MLRVVLVDDEPSVLEGLRIFVDWDKTGFMIAGEAPDGTAAFSIIQETRPDLVICDIRMPGLNGLELIEKVNGAVRPAPKFILLSGYNDFFYARHAMQLGALGYLTKPVDGEEVARQLSRAAAIIENEKRTGRENLELIRYAANQLYNDIMDGKRGEKLGRKARLIFDVPGDAKIRMVQLIADVNEAKKNIPDAELYDMFMDITGIQKENCVFFNGSGSYMAIMHEGMRKFNHPAEMGGQFSAKFGRTGANSQQDADSLLGAGSFGCRDFWLLISGISGGDILEAIYQCGKQLEVLHAYCLLRPECKIVAYETVVNRPEFFENFGTGSPVAFPDLPFDIVVNAVKGRDAGEVSGVVERFFSILVRSAGSYRLFSLCLYRLADIIRKIAYANGIEAGEAIRGFTDSVAVRSPDCKRLAADMCLSVFRKLNENRDKPMSLLENEIVGYIKANCRKSLSLQEIGEKFSLPAIMASKIIRKKTGRKFNDYLNYIRIERAKELIASADMKITAVSEESGYSDYEYFVEKFKEFTGVSPSEYKKKYSW